MSTFATNTVILKATLPSGNKAVYELHERHLDARLYPNQSRSAAVISYGAPLAVQNGDHWYSQRPGRPSWSERITDPKTIALLEAHPEV